MLLQFVAHVYWRLTFSLSISSSSAASVEGRSRARSSGEVRRRRRRRRLLLLALGDGKAAGDDAASESVGRRGEVSGKREGGREREEEEDRITHLIRRVCSSADFSLSLYPHSLPCLACLFVLPVSFSLHSVSALCALLPCDWSRAAASPFALLSSPVFSLAARVAACVPGPGPAK